MSPSELKYNRWVIFKNLSADREGHSNPSQHSLEDSHLNNYLIEVIEKINGKVEELRSWPFTELN